MKTLLFIIIFIPIVLFGQKTKSVDIYNDYRTGIYLTQFIDQKDTILVLYLSNAKYQYISDIFTAYVGNLDQMNEFISMIDTVFHYENGERYQYDESTILAQTYGDVWIHVNSAYYIMRKKKFDKLTIIWKEFYLQNKKK